LSSDEIVEKALLEFEADHIALQKLDSRSGIVEQRSVVSFVEKISLHINDCSKKYSPTPILKYQSTSEYDAPSFVQLFKWCDLSDDILK
jgi:hypothetical protein